MTRKYQSTSFVIVEIARNKMTNLTITDPFKLLTFLSHHNNNYAIPLANFGDPKAKRPSIQTRSLTKDIAFSYAPEVSFGLRSGLRGRVQSVTNLGNLLCWAFADPHVPIRQRQFVVGRGHFEADNQREEQGRTWP